MSNHQTCVWATSRDSWDSFLNDPALSKAIDEARRQLKAGSTGTGGEAQANAGASEGDNDEQPCIGARLRAYETPVTDEILRQSIR